MGKNNAYWTTALLIGNEGYTNVLRWNFIQPVSEKNCVFVSPFRCTELLCHKLTYRVFPCSYF